MLDMYCHDDGGGGGENGYVRHGDGAGLRTLQASGSAGGGWTKLVGG